jgi:hypothetical protein
MKISVIILFCLFTLCCLGQNTDLTFVSRSDSAKKYTAHVPFIADITTLNKRHIRTVVVDANDSILTTLKHISHKKDTNGHDTLMSRYLSGESKIQNNKSLTETEREAQISHLEESVFFRDTMRIKIDTLQSIKFIKGYPTKLAKACALGICCVSSFLFIDEFVQAEADSTNDPGRHKSSNYAWLGVAGIVGGIIWYSHVNHEVIYFKKWHIKH